MIEQRSEAWFSQRLGLCTASKFRAVISKLKSGKPAQARIDYAIELVTERLSGQPCPHFTTAAMQRGVDLEPAARIEYEFKKSIEVLETGFVRHPSLMTGASPDGLVGDDGLIEIKCPSSTAQVQTWINGMPEDHVSQVQGQLWITGRAWCDFVSFDDRLPKNLQLYVQRVERDDIFIANLDLEVRGFLDEVADLESQLRGKAI